MSCVPAVNDWDFTSVPELTVFTHNCHAAKGRATEVEVRSVSPTARALIGYYNRHCPFGTNATVQTLDLIASTTTFTLLKQHWPHCCHPSLQRLHVHQRTIPTCPS